MIMMCSAYRLGAPVSYDATGWQIPNVNVSQLQHTRVNPQQSKIRWVDYVTRSEIVDGVAILAVPQRDELERSHHYQDVI